MLKFVLAAVALAAADGGDRLGADLVPLTADLREYLALPADAKGAVVQGIRKGSPAEAAGLRAGDVVVRVGAASLEGVSDGEALRAALAPALAKAGDVEIEWVREGKRASGKATLAAPPEPRTTEAVAGAYRVVGELPPERLRAAAEALERHRAAFERDCGFPLKPKGAFAVAAFADPDALARSVAEIRGLAAVPPADELYVASRRVLGVVAAAGFRPGEESRVQILQEAWPGAPMPAWLLFGLARRGGLSGAKAAAADLEAAANALEAADAGGVPGIFGADPRLFDRRPAVWRPLACALVSFLESRAEAKGGDELTRMLSALREGTPWPKAQPAIFSEAARAALADAFAGWLLGRVKRSEASEALIRRALGAPPRPGAAGGPAEDPAKEEWRSFLEGFG